MTVRLFVALKIATDTLDEIAYLQDGLTAARWADEEQLHLTLNFIGEVGEHKLDEICACLSQVCLDPFEIEGKGLGVFPLKGTPRILWMGVNENENLLRLQTKTSEALREAGIQLEKRKFWPHITLGRINQVKKNHLLSYMEEHSLACFSPFIVKQFHLYTSTLHKHGAEYAIIENFSLL